MARRPQRESPDFAIVPRTRAAERERGRTDELTDPDQRASHDARKDPRPSRTEFANGRERTHAGTASGGKRAARIDQSGRTEGGFSDDDSLIAGKRVSAPRRWHARAHDARSLRLAVSSGPTLGWRRIPAGGVAWRRPDRSQARYVGNEIPWPLKIEGRAGKALEGTLSVE